MEKKKKKYTFQFSISPKKFSFTHALKKALLFTERREEKEFKIEWKIKSSIYILSNSWCIYFQETEEQARKIYSGSMFCRPFEFQ